MLCQPELREIRKLFIFPLALNFGMDVRVLVFVGGVPGPFWLLRVAWNLQSKPRVVRS